MMPGSITFTVTGTPRRPNALNPCVIGLMMFRWLFCVVMPIPAKSSLQAVCHLGEQQGRTAVCISIAELEPFGADALSGLEGHDIVCLDDVDRIAGQQVWEEAIFHLYNRIQDRGGLLLVSLSDLPASLPFGLPDLVSRFSHGLVIQLGIYRDEDRLKILRARAEQRGWSWQMTSPATSCAGHRGSSVICWGFWIYWTKTHFRPRGRLTIPFVKTVMDW